MSNQRDADFHMLGACLKDLCVLRPSFALRAHCRCTAGMCIKEHPEEEEETSSEAKADVQQHNRTI